MMKDLYIIGAGGFGREVAWIIERINDVALHGILKVLLMTMNLFGDVKRMLTR